MPEQREVAETVPKPTIQEIELSLQKLWEKAHAVSEALRALKKENKELRAQLDSYKEQAKQRGEALIRQQQELESLRQKIKELQSTEHSLIPNEEREELVTKVRELIAKINSHL